MVGGIDPANQGNYGPGSGQIIAHVPPLPIGALGSKGGGKRGGGGFLEFGGFPQLIGTAWDNTLNDIKNVANGYNGNKLLPSASGWNQPLAKGYTAPPLKPSTQFLALTTART